MAFAIDAVGAGPLRNSVDVLIVRFATFRFEAGPIKTKGAIVEQGGKALAILFFLVRPAAVIEHEKVTAEPEIMAKLLDSYFGITHRFAFGVSNDDDAATQAMLLDASLGLGQDFLVGDFASLSFSA